MPPQLRQMLNAPAYELAEVRLVVVSASYGVPGDAARTRDVRGRLQKIIDGGGPNGMAFLSRVFAGRLSRLQSGYVYHYAFVMLLGVAGFLAFALYAWGA